MKWRICGGLAASVGLLCAALFSACSGSDGARGPAGSAALVVTSTEPAGTHCASGGIEIEIGLDTNGDGALSLDEIGQTQYVCNGVDGNAGPAGQDGADGASGDPGEPGPKGDTGDAGPKGDTGSQGDTGDAGPKGDTGDAGPKGDTGPPGDAGANGSNALVSVDPESAGNHCEFGGIRVRSGIDTNDNGTLDDSEVQSTQYVCNGAPGSSGAAGNGGSAGTLDSGGAAGV
ncbi:MAG TPA: hypothetical protein VHV51_11330 [Polyangiaceae bacterium]|nr:hypothetical protein [Polyangiaceae bacterium]